MIITFKNADFNLVSPSILSAGIEKQRILKGNHTTNCSWTRLVAKRQAAYFHSVAATNLFARPNAITSNDQQHEMIFHTGL